MNQVYSPTGMPELELSYDTRTGEVDICDAKINGQRISDPLYQLIIERNRAIFETAILFHLKKTAELDSADKAGLDAEINTSISRSL